MNEHLTELFEIFSGLVTPKTETFTIQAVKLDKAIEELKLNPSITDIELHVFVVRYMQKNDVSEIGNYPDVMEWVREELKR